MLPRYVDRTHTPGAVMSTSEPRFEKSAKVSSTSRRPKLVQVADDRLPLTPSKSAMAETVMTSS